MLPAEPTRQDRSTQVLRGVAVVSRSGAASTLRGDRGVEYEVLKNFPTPHELRERLRAAGARSIEVVELPYYWYATYDIASAA